MRSSNRLTCAAFALGLIFTVGCGRKQEAAQVEFKQVADASAASGDPLQAMTARFGVPIYPGATLDASRFAVIDRNDPAERKMYLLLLTADAPEKVAEYYQGMLAAESRTMAGATTLRGQTANGATVTVNVGRDTRSGKTAFAITASFPVNTAVVQANSVVSPTYYQPPAPPTKRPQQEDAVVYETSPSYQDVAPAPADPAPEPPVYEEPVPDPPPVDEPPPYDEPPPMDEGPPGDDSPPL